MEPKRELTSVDLAALVSELSAYRGATVDKAYLYGGDLLRLKLRDRDRGRLELLVEVGDVKRAHLADPEHVPDAPGRPPDFAMKLRSRIAGGDLAEVSQYEFDRILRFRFSRPDGDTTLVVELFGDGNVAVLDPTDRVLDSLETVRLKSRTVVSGAQYEYPASRVNPLRLSRDGFAAHMDDSNTDLVRTLATQLNFGGLYAEELCTRAGVEKTRPIAEATDEDYDALFAEIEALQADLAAGVFEPRVYYDGVEGDSDGDDGSGGPGAEQANRRPVDATPFPLEEHEADGLESEPFETFDAALDAYFFELEREETVGDQGPDFEERIAKQERIVAQQESAIERFAEEAEAEREKAESLYARYDLVDEILTTVREARAEHGWEEIESRLAAGAERGIAAAEAVRGVDPAAGTVTVDVDGRDVELDPSVGVEKNANRLYNAAKEVEAKREGAKEALVETEAALASLREQRAAHEAGEAGGEGESGAGEEGAEVDWLSESSIPVRKTEPWYERFRWFHTSDGFLVLGGRNAEQNEELVKKYLERGDRFFHSQAHGAPATVLKATGPSEAARDVEFPESTLSQAAQFAVSYSSVWKDGHFSGDVYVVDPDQVTKTPESGEYLEKGAFAIRGDRTYFDDTPVGAAVGIACEPETRVIGGPPEAVGAHAETWIEVEPGRYAQGDVAKRMYREFRERFADTTFVRKVASPDEIAKFLPPGGSRIIEG